MIILAQDGTAIKPAVAERDRRRRRRHRLRPPDRGSDGPLHHVRQRPRRQAPGRGPPQGQGLGQLRHHQGQQGRRQRRLPARRAWSRRVCRTSTRADKLKIVGETYTDNWDPAKAQTEMEQFLTANDNKIDIAFVENDGMAGGVVAALDGPGPRRQGPGVRPGRRRCRPQPGRPRHPDGRRLEGRAAARQGGRRGRRRSSATTRTSRRSPGVGAVQQPGRQRHDARSCSPRSRSPRTTSTSSSTPAGSTRTRSARA